MRSTAAYLVVIAMLLATAIGVQVWRDRGWTPYAPQTPVLWLKDPGTMRKLALGFDSLVADIYWVRAVVYFGQQRLAGGADKTYGLLYPYLNLVTALDPRFITAYRFGAIFLSEDPPGGPDRPNQAIELLERGMELNPGRWEYAHDIAFVHYWSYRDPIAAARWMRQAAAMPGAPVWLKTSAASMLELGHDRESARRMWQQMRDSSDEEWVRRTAALRMAQLDALQAIDQLNEIVWRYEARVGRLPKTWQELVAAGVLRRVPLDPAGVPFELDQLNEDVQLSKESPLWPLPHDFAPGQ